MQSAKEIKKKICLLGSFGVGKTSMVRRFVHDIFEDRYLSTIGVKVSQKLMAPIESGSGTMVQYNFLLWDIEGHEQGDQLRDNYYLGAAGALIVCDMTRPETVSLIPEILEQFRTINPKSQIVVAGNKMDLLGKEHPSLEKIEAIAAGQKIDFLLSSAKSGINVEQSFITLAKAISGAKQ